MINRMEKIDFMVLFFITLAFFAKDPLIRAKRVEGREPLNQAIG
jgi:hypothetical protein